MSERFGDCLTGLNPFLNQAASFYGADRGISFCALDNIKAAYLQPIAR
jgi:hypothetical protein